MVDVVEFMEYFTPKNGWCPQKMVMLWKMKRNVCIAGKHPTLERLA